MTCRYCHFKLCAVPNCCIVADRVHGAFSQQPGQRQRPQKRVAPPPKARKGALPGMRSMPTRQRSMLGLAAKPSLERCTSAKRRRTDYDCSDMIMPHMSGSAGPKYVERVQVGYLEQSASHLDTLHLLLS